MASKYKTVLDGKKKFMSIEEYCSDQSEKPRKAIIATIE